MWFPSWTRRSKRFGARRNGCRCRPTRGRILWWWFLWLFLALPLCGSKRSMLRPRLGFRGWVRFGFVVHELVSANFLTVFHHYRTGRIGRGNLFLLLEVLLVTAVVAVGSEQTPMDEHASSTTSHDNENATNNSEGCMISSCDLACMSLLLLLLFVGRRTHKPNDKEPQPTTTTTTTNPNQPTRKRPNQTRKPPSSNKQPRMGSPLCVVLWMGGVALPRTHTKRNNRWR